MNSSCTKPTSKTPQTKMPQPVDSSKTTFLDLPPELRNSIYDFALVAAEPLRVFEPENANLSPNLLATCKTINAEATPVLYGCNRFHDSRYEVTRWLRRHSRRFGAKNESIKYVRHIAVHTAMEPSDIAFLAGQLKYAVSLQSLDISSWPHYYGNQSFRWKPSEEDMVEDLHNLQKDLAEYKAKKHGLGGDAKPLCESITFSVDSRYDDPHICKMMMPKAEAYTQKIRAQLKGLMEGTQS